VRQKTLADEGFEKFRKKTRKEQFPDAMEPIVPWRELTASAEDVA
jgi:transposase, IS5 family